MYAEILLQIWENLVGVFAIKHSSNMGVKGHLPHSGDVCWAPPADLGKSRWGLAIMHPWQFGVKWGSIAGLHQLS